jgi:hypothetical protein
LIGLQQESSSEGEIKDSPEKGDQSFADPGTRKKGQKKRSTCPPYRGQCFGFGFIDSGSGSGSRSSILGGIPIRIPIQGFDDLKFKRIYSQNKIYTYFFFISKIAIYLSLGLVNDVRAVREAFSPQKITSSTSKHELF